MIERLEKIEARLSAVEAIQAANVDFKAQLIQLKWVLIGGVVAFSVGVALVIVRNGLML